MEAKTATEIRIKVNLRDDELEICGKTPEEACADFQRKINDMDLKGGTITLYSFLELEAKVRKIFDRSQRDF